MLIDPNAELLEQIRRDAMVVALTWDTFVSYVTQTMLNEGIVGDLPAALTNDFQMHLMGLERALSQYRRLMLGLGSN